MRGRYSYHRPTAVPGDRLVVFHELSPALVHHPLVYLRELVVDDVASAGASPFGGRTHVQSHHVIEWQVLSHLAAQPVVDLRPILDVVLLEDAGHPEDAVVTIGRVLLPMLRSGRINESPGHHLHLVRAAWLPLAKGQEGDRLTIRPAPFTRCVRRCIKEREIWKHRPRGKLH